MRREVLSLESGVRPIDSEASYINSEVIFMKSKAPLVESIGPALKSKVPKEFKMSFKDIFRENALLGVDPTEHIIFSFTKI